MSRKLALATIAAAGFAALGQPALANSPALSGNWNLTWIFEPDRKSDGPDCIRFQRTNTVQEVTRYSGTWDSEQYPEWTGEWIQLGDYVYWWGIYPPDKRFFAFSGNMVTGRFMGGESYSFFNRKGNAVSAGTFTMKRGACHLDVEMKSSARGAPGPAGN